MTRHYLFKTWLYRYAFCHCQKGVGLLNIHEINIMLTGVFFFCYRPSCHMSFIFTQTIPLPGPTYVGTVESKEKLAALRSVKAYERIEV